MLIDVCRITKKTETRQKTIKAKIKCLKLAQRKKQSMFVVDSSLKLKLSQKGQFS